MELVPSLKATLIRFLIMGCVCVAHAEENYQYRSQITADQEIHFLEIDPKLYKIVAVKASQKGVSKDTVSNMVANHGALAGINGGFFEEDGSPSGVLKIDGKWFGLSRTPRAAIGWNKDGEQVLLDRILAKKNNDQEIVVVPQIDTSAQIMKTWQQLNTIVGGIPLLIKDGNMIDNHSHEKTIESFRDDKHARTAVCIKDDNHWLFVVASHVKPPARPYVPKVVEGLSIKELKQLLKQQGCKSAINLDGGGSSTLVIHNQVKNSFAGDFDEATRKYQERPVADAILIYAKN